MSARGDAGRRARWAAKDKQWDEAQLHATLESWLGALPDHLIERLATGCEAIFGKRYRSSGPINSTIEERNRVAVLLEEVNLAWSSGQTPSVIQPGQKEISMSLEQALAANTAALEANTAAIKTSGGTVTATGATTNKTKPPKDEVKADKPKHTREELSASAEQVKANKGGDVAKALIAEHSTTGKLAGVPDDKIDTLFDAFAAKLAEEDSM